MVWLPTPSFKHFICHDLMNSIASESKSWIFDMEMQYYYLGRSTFSSSSLATCQIRYSNFESDTVSYLYMFDYRLSKLGMCYVFLQDDWLRKWELLMIQIKFFFIHLSWKYMYFEMTKVVRTTISNSWQNIHTATCTCIIYKSIQDHFKIGIYYFRIKELTLILLSKK